MPSSCCCLYFCGFSGQLPECRNDQWQCDDGDCISDIQRCDGDGDCLDGSDEMDCTGRNSFYLCESKKSKIWYIISNSLLQLLVSCRFEMLHFMCNKACFNENEFSCFSIYIASQLSKRNIGDTLSANFFLYCYWGEPKVKAWIISCVHKVVTGIKSRQNNQLMKWKNPSEIYCSCFFLPLLPGLSECPQGQFPCRDSIGCVNVSARCDGQIQCPTGSDEENCPPAQGCLESDWTCHNHICIPKEQRCNRLNDCLDNSDEENCGKRELWCLTGYIIHKRYKW